MRKENQKYQNERFEKEGKNNDEIFTKDRLS